MSANRVLKVFSALVSVGLLGLLLLFPLLEYLRDNQPCCKTLAYFDCSVLPSVDSLAVIVCEDTFEVARMEIPSQVEMDDETLHFLWEAEISWGPADEPCELEIVVFADKIGHRLFLDSEFRFREAVISGCSLGFLATKDEKLKYFVLC